MNHYTKEPTDADYIHNSTDNYDLEIDYYPESGEKQLSCLDILKIIFSCLFFI